VGNGRAGLLAPEGGQDRYFDRWL